MDTSNTADARLVKASASIENIEVTPFVSSLYLISEICDVLNYSWNTRHLRQHQRLHYFRWFEILLDDVEINDNTNTNNMIISSTLPPVQILLQKSGATCVVEEVGLQNRSRQALAQAAIHRQVL